MPAIAARAAERFGFPYADILDAIPFAALLLMLRQPGPFDAEPQGFGSEELDLLDWMRANNKSPGDDLAAFFQ